MATTDIRVSGFGGQGVIKLGYIIGKGASLFDDKFGTLTQSFGPEARGGACSAGVVVSDEPVRYPYLKSAKVLITMSQEAYSKFIDDLDDDAVVLYETDLVKLDDRAKKYKCYGVPAIRLAEELGRKIVLNMVMLGFFTAITGLIDKEAMRKAVMVSIPKGTERLNDAAYDKGYEHGKKLLEEEH